MAAGHLAPEVVIETHDTMNLGAGDVQLLRQKLNRVLVDVTEFFLKRVQHRQQCAT